MVSINFFIKVKQYNLFNVVNLEVFLTFSILLFLVGLLGILSTRKNIIIVLISIELMLLSININFIFFSIFLNDIYGQIFSLIILTVAAAEASVGLALLVLYYRLRNLISIDYISTIKG